MIEMKNNEICILSEGYPIGNSNARIFVKKLVDEWVRQGKKCVVIAPQSITKVLIRGETKRPYKMKIDVCTCSYELYSPKYISFSGFSLFGFSFSAISNFLFRKSCLRVCSKECINADVYYGHFLNPAGTAAIELKRKRGGKAFFAFGEGTDTVDNFLCKYKENRWIDYLDGVISVNSKNKQYLIKSKYNISDKQIGVFINACDKHKFFHINQAEARKRLGVNDNIFIISFVGTFDERKGIQRICEAIKDENDVYSFFIGKGHLQPEIKNILYKGPVENEKINLYLNASDVFVLPTLNEGCCNAIIESLSCGTPVISSNREFNADIMVQGGTVAIDPENIEQIRQAIVYMKNHPENRDKMTNVCLEFTKNLTIEKRASAIYDFLMKG